MQPRLTGDREMIYRYLPWRLRIPITAFVLRRHNVQFGKHFAFPRAIPHILNRGSFKIGQDTTIDYYSRRSIFWIPEGGTLEIGRACYINEAVNIAAHLSVKIGDHCHVAPNVQIMDCDQHEVTPGKPPKKQPVVIGRNCWIATNAVVLPGSVIGDHSVIGAGSVVRGEIPDRCLAAGNPAKMIRRFEAPDDWIRT